MAATQIVSTLGVLFLVAAMVYLVQLCSGLGPGELARRFGHFFADAEHAWRRWLLPGINEFGRLVFRGYLTVSSPKDSDSWGRRISLLEGYDEEHAERVAEIAQKLGTAAGLADDVLISLGEAGQLHDVGMLNWDLNLDCSRTLAAGERVRLPEHVWLGEELARQITADPFVIAWIRWSHERYDGSGYPDGLVQEQIPLPAQILGLADTFDALTHARPYRGAFEPPEALNELQRLAGIHFAPDLVALFARAVYPNIFAAICLRKSGLNTLS